MPDFATRLLAEWQVIEGAPISFLTAVILVGAIIWTVLHFTFKTSIAAAKAEASSARQETQFLDRKVKDYEAKLQGLSPEAARSALDELERQLREQQAGSIVAWQALDAGDLVHVFTNEEGQARVRRADRRLALRAVGFVRAACRRGEMALVYGNGIVHDLVDLTPGQICFLAENGTVMHGVPAGAKTILQHVGEAASSTSLIFKAGEAILLA